MQTYTVSPTIYNICNTWPLTCLNCGGDDIIYSEREENYRCQECGEWQLTDEE